MVFGDYKPDHAVCRLAGKEWARKEWGCDAPAPESVFETGCSLCSGADLKCPRCKGTGVAEWRRCPASMLSEAPRDVVLSIDAAFTAYQMFDARNVTPVPGGWLAQSAWFGRFCGVADDERGRLRKVELDEMKEKREKAEKEAGKGGGWVS